VFLEVCVSRTEALGLPSPTLRTWKTCMASTRMWESPMKLISWMPLDANREGRLPRRRCAGGAGVGGPPA